MNLRELLLENRTLRQTIFKNTFWLFSGHTVSRLFKFFLIVYAARILGVVEYGSFSLALAIGAIAFMFSDIGLNALLIREFPKKETDPRKLISTSFYLKIILIFLSIAIALPLQVSFRHQISALIFWLVVGLYIFDVFRDFFISIAGAEEKMQLQSFALIAEGIATTALGFFFLYHYGTVFSLVLAYVTGSGIGIVVGAFTVKQRLSGIFSFFDSLSAKRILAAAWPFAFAAVISASLIQIDIIMLGWLKDATAVGQYSVGSRIIQMLFIIPMLVAGAIFPSTSRLVFDKERIATITQKAISFMMLIAVPITFGGIALSQRIISKVFGDAFLRGADSFSLLLFVMVMFSATIILDYLLLILNLQKKDMEYTAIAAGLNVILNLLFILRWGIIGAAAATAISQFVNLFLTLRLAHKVVQFPLFPVKHAVLYIVAGIAMTVFIFLFWHISLWFLVPLSALFYFCMLFALRAPLMSETVELIKG